MDSKIYTYRKKKDWFACQDCGEPTKEGEFCNRCGGKAILIRDKKKHGKGENG